VGETAIQDVLAARRHGGDIFLTCAVLPQGRHASHAIERGATLGEVRDQLGHADIKITSLYIHSTLSHMHLIDGQGFSRQASLTFSI
jgi:hypothetical protein